MNAMRVDKPNEVNKLRCSNLDTFPSRRNPIQVNGADHREMPG